MRQVYYLLLLFWLANNKHACGQIWTKTTAFLTDLRHLTQIFSYKMHAAGLLNNLK